MTTGVLPIRLSKIVMTGGLALFTFLVVLGNVTDPMSNYQFVQHVLSMDTVFPDSTLTWRALTSPSMHMLAFVIIIFGEALTCLSFAISTWAMSRAIRASNAEFKRAKSWTAIGVLFGFVTWFVAFMGIGGEWFAMWQSATWNGQQSASYFYVAVLGVGIYVFQDTDGDRL
ncbi:MAG: DUF2165 domain-containing protein [Pseudomonadota bacterium]